MLKSNDFNNYSADTTGCFYTIETIFIKTTIFLVFKQIDSFSLL